MTEKEAYEKIGRRVVHHMRTNKPFRKEFNARQVGVEVGAIITEFYEGIDRKKLPWYKRIIERGRGLRSFNMQELK